MPTHYPKTPAVSQVRFSITTTKEHADTLDAVAREWNRMDKAIGIVRPEWSRTSVILQFIKDCLRVEVRRLPQKDA